MKLNQYCNRIAMEFFYFAINNNNNNMPHAEMAVKSTTMFLVVWV